MSHTTLPVRRLAALCAAALIVACGARERLAGGATDAGPIADRGGLLDIPDGAPDVRVAPTDARSGEDGATRPVDAAPRDTPDATAPTDTDALDEGPDALPVDQGANPPRRPGPSSLHGIPSAEGFEASLCQQFCHWAAHCDDTDTFGGRDLCPQTCAAMLADGQGVAVACYVSRCSAAERCFEESPPDVAQQCHRLCVRSAECPGALVFGLPQEPAACRLMCEGKAHAHPEFAETLPCLTSHSGICELDEGLACVTRGSGWFCSTLCEEIDGCAGGPLAEVFADKEACYRECADQDAAAAWRMRSCFDLLECDADRACLYGDDLPVCETYADAVVDRCTAGFWPPERSLIVTECSLLLDALGFAAAADPAACLTADDTCLSYDSRLPPTCSYEVSPRCSGLCAPPERCGAGPRDAFCEGRCELFVRREGEAAADDRAACVDAAACDPAARQACFTDAVGHGRDTCAERCDFRRICEPGPFDDAACRADCADQLRAGLTEPIRTLACVGRESCEVYRACVDEAPPAARDPACLAPCRGDVAVCHHVQIGFDTGFEACVAVCSDTLARRGAGGDAARAACVVSAIDHDCRLGALDGCFEGP